MNIRLKTNLKCDGCVADVTPHLAEIEGLKHWEIDLTTPERTATLDLADAQSLDAVLQAFQNAGYRAEILPEAPQDN